MWGEYNTSTLLCFSGFSNIQYCSGIGSPVKSMMALVTVEEIKKSNALEGGTLLMQEVVPHYSFCSGTLILNVSYSC